MRNSTIQSSLFMIDPVEKQEIQKSSIFYTKGGSDLESDMDINGTDGSWGNLDSSKNDVPDTINLKLDDVSYKLQRSVLTGSLEELKAHANTQVKNLSPELTDIFRNIVKVLKVLRGSKEHYEIVLKRYT